MQKRRVLIVDDDDVDRLIYKRHLGSDPQGIEVITAETADQGIALLQGTKVDCVLLDYHLPAVDGLEFLDLMRETHATCPVIMLTGVGDEQVAVSAMKRGAADYLVKGRHSSTELIRAVRASIDTSELRRRLDAANERMATVLDTVNSAIIALNRNADILLINPAARHVLGGTTAEVPFPWPAHVRFLDRQNLSPLDASSSPVNRALAGQRILEEVNVLSRSKDGPGRYVRVSSRIVDSPDSTVRAVLVMDDVTEEITNREQVERAHRLDALGQLTGGVAHDFNNLLGTLLYAIELTAIEDQSERIQRILETAKGTIQRGTKLTGRLLSFAKRQPTLESSRSVTGVISDLVAITESTIGKNIKLVSEMPDGDMPVYCDQSQLENAILNLILNARDAILKTGREGTIRVSCRNVEAPQSDADRSETDSTYIVRGRLRDEEEEEGPSDGLAYRYVEISVTDNGDGMSPEVRRRSIDPFFTTKDTASGTGLGLSMVYGFIQQSSGELRIYSEEGVGTTIRLTLPRGTDHGGREEATTRDAVPTGQGEKILVVEDEAHLLEVTSDLLETLGYQTLSASSGPAALDLLEQDTQFDLLLTDIVLVGGISGFELAQYFRKKLPDLPVLYMSGYTGFTRKEMGEVVAPLIPKPCFPGELAVAIRKALENSNGQT